MKRSFLILMFLLSLNILAQSYGFVHPLEYQDNEINRTKVIEYIKSNVKKTYSQIGMDNPSTLRMMEKEELKCFKELTKVNNRKLLDRIIKTYCDIGMCSYNTILMMYNEELKASSEELKW
ncbi:MAG: hypothetical protein FMNOHCHN_00555 [Ignavibacteriaceae bacterium]|nr:hypothetical protein [Ignavibacteriaceae bacterium]